MPWPMTVCENDAIVIEEGTRVDTALQKMVYFFPGDPSEYQTLP